MMAVRPSRMSSPRRLSSFSFSRFLARAYLLTDVGEGLLEALLVHAALGGGDAVGEGVDALVVAGVPLEGDLDLLVVLGGLEVRRPLEQRLLRRVQVAARSRRCRPCRRSVTPARGPGRSSLKRISRPLLRKAIICRRSSTVWARNSVPSSEDGRVRPERDGGAGAARAAPWPTTSSLAWGLPPLANSMRWCVAVAVDLDDEPLRQRVDDRDAHAVEAAGDLVAAAAELAAGVQHGEHDLGRALALLRAVDVGRPGCRGRCRRPGSRRRPAA